MITRCPLAGRGPKSMVFYMHTVILPPFVFGTCSRPSQWDATAAWIYDGILCHWPSTLQLWYRYLMPFSDANLTNAVHLRPTSHRFCLCARAYAHVSGMLPKMVTHHCTVGISAVLASQNSKKYFAILKTKFASLHCKMFMDHGHHRIFNTEHFL